MQHNTPFDPPTSEFPFGLCQQRIGVHLLNRPSTSVQVALTEKHLSTGSFICFLLAITNVISCLASAAQPQRHCGCCGWWWQCGWLDETRLAELEQHCVHVTKAHPSPCDLCRVQPVPWLRVQADSGEGRREGGRERGRLDGKWRVFKGRVKVWGREGERGRDERGEAGRFMPWQAPVCSSALHTVPACVRHMAQHAAGNPSCVHVRSKCEDAHRPKHNTHTQVQPLYVYTCALRLE